METNFDFEVVKNLKVKSTYLEKVSWNEYPRPTVSKYFSNVYFEDKNLDSIFESILRFYLFENCIYSMIYYAYSHGTQLLKGKGHVAYLNTVGHVLRHTLSGYQVTW